MTDLSGLPAPPPEEKPERHPFWSYTDLLYFIGFALPSLLGGTLLVKAITALFHLKVHQKVFELLPGQFAGYGILFFLLWALFKLEYGRPLWSSLGWVRSGRNPAGTFVLGVLLALGVGALSALLRTPDINSPMKELLSDRASIILVGVFGVTLGPFFEELIFRGFMQPLFVRSLGVIPGILCAAIPFGVLHLQEYAWSWRHGLLITLAGAAFGWMRHVSGSTRASVFMHAAYNSTFFMALVSQGKNLPHTY